MANITLTPSEVVYNWVIVQLECEPSVDGLQDYVVSCHYRYNGVYYGIFKDHYGVCTFDVNPSKSDFVAYADLTESHVISWLESSINTESYKLSIANQIIDALNPPIIVLPLPWVNF